MGYWPHYRALKGPFLIQSVLNYPPVTFGTIAALMGAAWMVGNLSAKKAISVSDAVKTPIALTYINIVIVVMLILSWATSLSLLGLTIPIGLAVIGGAFIFPGYIAECMSTFPDRADSANAFTFSCTWLITAIITRILSHISRPASSPSLGATPSL